MTGVENDLKSRFRPGAMQIPGIGHRTNNVVPTLHDHSRYVSNPTDVFNQVIVSLKEAIVHEVMAFDPRQSQSEMSFARVVNQLLIGK